MTHPSGDQFRPCTTFSPNLSELPLADQVIPGNASVLLELLAALRYPGKLSDERDEPVPRVAGDRIKAG